MQTLLIEMNGIGKSVFNGKFVFTNESNLNIVQVHKIVSDFFQSWHLLQNN